MSCAHAPALCPPPPLAVVPPCLPPLPKVQAGGLHQREPPDSGSGPDGSPGVLIKHALRPGAARACRWAAAHVASRVPQSTVWGAGAGRVRAGSGRGAGPIARNKRTPTEGESEWWSTPAVKFAAALGGNETTPLWLWIAPWYPCVPVDAALETAWQAPFARQRRAGAAEKPSPWPRLAAAWGLGPPCACCPTQRGGVRSVLRHLGAGGGRGPSLIRLLRPRPAVATQRHSGRCLLHGCVGAARLCKNGRSRVVNFGSGLHAFPLTSPARSVIALGSGLRRWLQLRLGALLANHRRWQRLTACPWTDTLPMEDGLRPLGPQHVHRPAWLQELTARVGRQSVLCLACAPSADPLVLPQTPRPETPCIAPCCPHRFFVQVRIGKSHLGLNPFWFGSSLWLADTKAVLDKAGAGFDHRVRWTKLGSRLIDFETGAINL